MFEMRVAGAALGAAISAWTMGCGSSVTFLPEHDDNQGAGGAGGAIELPQAPVGTGGGVSEPPPPPSPPPAPPASCDDVPQADPPGFTLGPFYAAYFHEDDGNDPLDGGTDGSDPSIVPVLKGSEPVDYPAIQYAWSDWFNINAYGFYGVWTGTIHVQDPTVTVDANFDMDWSHASLSIDEQLISAWSNTRKTIPLTLTNGTHSVSIEYHNHWHTAGFNASFTKHQKAPTSEGPAAVQPYLPEGTKVAYVSAYDGASNYNEATVIIEENSSPILLVLHSLRAINWTVDARSCITAVVVNSPSSGSTVQGIGTTAVLQLDGWLPYDAPDAAVTLVGQAPAHTAQAYSLSTVTVPNLN